MKRTVLLLLFGLTSWASFAQEFFSQPQQWVITAVTDVNANKKSNHTTTFITRKETITWSQPGLTTEFKILKVEGEWKDLQKPGSVTLTTHDSDGEVVLKFSRRSSRTTIHMQVLPAGPEYVFEVVQRKPDGE